MYEAALPLAKPPPKANVQSTISGSYRAGVNSGSMNHIPMNLDACNAACETHDMRDVRKELPAWDKREEVLKCVQDYQVV